MKPHGGDQPNKKQSRREPKTKSTDNPEQIQDIQSTIVTSPSKAAHRQMRTARKRDLCPPRENKRKRLSLDTFIEKTQSYKTHIPVIAKTT